MITEPIATTVAGDEPETAANNAHASTAASPRPPCQWPTIEVANAIMRRATPPWVRKLPARMKNGIAMISNFSMPVNSFRATDSIGTLVSVNRKVSTVRPSAIEIGMPVSISDSSSDEHHAGAQALRQHDEAELLRQADRSRSPAAQNSSIRPEHAAVLVGTNSCDHAAHGLASRRLDVVEALDMAVIVMRQCAGPGRSAKPPAGSGSTSGRSRAARRDRRSTSALRDRSSCWPVS